MKQRTHLAIEATLIFFKMQAIPTWKGDYITGKSNHQWRPAMARVVLALNGSPGALLESQVGASVYAGSWRTRRRWNAKGTEKDGAPALSHLAGDGRGPYLDNA